MDGGVGGVVSDSQKNKCGVEKDVLEYVGQKKKKEKGRERIKKNSVEREKG